ncbi:G protein pathway suppressor 1 [Lenzites betulinus]|nr:G protein pathway suppressor 1 [Lenzites betulinus]
MDVDSLEHNYVHQTVLPNLQPAAGKRPLLRLAVDEAHPFELEAYISSYSGRTYIERLLHIMPLCPPLAPQALQLAIAEALKGRDTHLYRLIFHTYERVRQDATDELPELSALATVDQAWLDETAARNLAERTKLEVELKTYSSNMIKESIRMAHRDLGDFYRADGESSAALKHYTKSREFCTTSQHVLDMCLSVIELLIEQCNYSHIATYVFKAEAALDSASTVRTNTGPEAPAGSAQASKEKRTAERERVQTKLDVAAALSHLGQGSYEKAAHTFLKAGPVKGLDEWSGKIIAPGDIAIYAILCALATFTRPAIRTHILDNDNFGMYIEQEPYVRELVESYMSNRFKNVLDILERYSTRHSVDIHLLPHVTSLTNLIRNETLVLYFQPFSSIRLDRMGQAFGWTVDEIEQQVVTLIQSGHIKARVDRQNKILKAKETDERAALFAKAIKSGQERQAADRKLLLRMRLQQADLIVKQPKGQQQQQQQVHGYGGNSHPLDLLSGEY